RRCFSKVCCKLRSSKLSPDSPDFAAGSCDDDLPGLPVDLPEPEAAGLAKDASSVGPEGHWNEPPIGRHSRRWQRPGFPPERASKILSGWARAPERTRRDARR